MAQFQYTAKGQDGRTIVGMLEAVDEATAMRTLSEKFELVTSIIQARPGRRGLLGWRFSGEDLLAFTEQMAEMLESGIPLTGALEILLQDFENPVRHAVVSDILATVNGGTSLSEALRKHPRIFNKLYCTMVEAGEASGKLPLMLARLATYQQRSEAVRRQLRASLVYPTIVLVFAAVVVTFILIFGVPRISQMYSSMGAQLPFLTRIFVDVCLFLATWWYVWILVAAAGVYGLATFLRSPAGSNFLQNLGGKLFGELMRNIAMARFSRTLATLYASAVPLGEALEMVAGSVGSPRLEGEVAEVRQRVLNGEPLAVALRRSPQFPALLVGMVAAGQEAGALDRMLMKLADIYESKVDSGLRAAVGALEPMVIILVGMMVAGTIIVLGLPFLNLGALMQ